MLNKIIIRLLDLWAKLSLREKRLAMLTGSVVVLMLAVMTFQRVSGSLRELDNTLSRLEDTLVSYTYQIAHREMVEAKYASVAAQHSSAWTEAEIHDRLRQEIYRLARNSPQDLDKNGIPLNTPNTEGNLVEIPALGKGSMAEGGQGYREYMLNLRIPSSTLDNVIFFLERLQRSPQSLRIDGLEINRSPESELVSATIDISRIIADGTPGSGQDTPAAPAEDISEEAVSTSASPKTGSWQGTAIQAEKLTLPGLPAREDNAVIASLQEQSEAYMLRTLEKGAVYHMSLDLCAGSHDMTVGVGLEQDRAPFPGSQTITGNGESYRLQVQFTLPGKPGGLVPVKCPWILFNEKDTKAEISNIVIRKIAEV
ncbi:MAG TPA: hypothetical protein PLQ42_06275 [Candidatus Hydrogenedentes bacterium]|jgi:hypothetical protein|nr:hypothetical protein [Candidatus Hydrogenedentota bacterium]